MPLSVFLHDIEKTGAPRITKLDIGTFHHESLKPNYFRVKRSKVKVTRQKKHCRRVSWRFCECWLFPVRTAAFVF